LCWNKAEAGFDSACKNLDSTYLLFKNGGKYQKNFLDTASKKRGKILENFMNIAAALNHGCDSFI